MQPGSRFSTFVADDHFAVPRSDVAEVSAPRNAVARFMVVAQACAEILKMKTLYVQGAGVVLLKDLVLRVPRTATPHDDIGPLHRECVLTDVPPMHIPEQVITPGMDAVPAADRHITEISSRPQDEDRFLPFRLRTVTHALVRGHIVGASAVKGGVCRDNNRAVYDPGFLRETFLILPCHTAAEPCQRHANDHDLRKINFW